MEVLIHGTQCLYRRTLGEAFDRLPQVLKNFHNQPCEAVAQGSLRITRGKGWMRQALAAAMHLPMPGEQVPIQLRVQVDGEEEHWTRDFGSLRLVTRQWLHRDLLMESAGPMRFGFHLEARGLEMHFVFARCWFIGIPLPTVLAPQVNASVIQHEAGWWVRVSVEVPVLGMITRYEGKVTPQC